MRENLYQLEIQSAFWKASTVDTDNAYLAIKEKTETSLDSADSDQMLVV